MVEQRPKEHRSNPCHAGQQDSAAARQLRDHVKAFLSEFCERLERVCGTDSRLQRLKAIPLEGVCKQPSVLEVTRYWDRAFEGTDPGPIAGLVEKLRSLYPFLSWIQNPNYTKDYARADFLANYGYAEIIGKDGMYRGDSVALGILMLGPATIYSEHSHPASEVYYVVAGTAMWNLGGSPDIASRPGTLITIPSGVIHQMWTTGDPLIAIYVWEGDVETRARFVSDGQPRRT